ncbi:putative aminoacylase-1 [Cocos nucifera]|uniref:Putative aminoacylase-1 n=1 Tax=Cocos nucifera TaxID=13894 RepID=A0A8K0IH43_COCNU|nr:putative aminoacylase-1 [Cocos nucifera]
MKGSNGLASPRLLRLHFVLLFLLLSVAVLTVAALENENKGSSLSGSEAESAISRFREYLRINTSHPEPDYAAAVVLFLRAQVDDLGLESDVLEFAAGKPLLLLRWPGRIPSLPALLLNSHTDVVPAEALKSAHPPFSADLDPTTGNIYARGSQDMKCVGLQYLEAIRRLRAATFAPDRTIYLSFVPDEEIVGNDGVSESLLFVVD